MSDDNEEDTPRRPSAKDFEFLDHMVQEYRELSLINGPTGKEILERMAETHGKSLPTYVSATANRNPKCSAKAWTTYFLSDRATDRGELRQAAGAFAEA